MTLELSLTRTGFTDQATTGDLSVGDTLYCASLEDCDRRLEDDPNGKIAGETAIPRGRYRVGVSHSAHFGRDLPILFEVPGFEGVRIHPGNSDKDTEGCLLVGKLSGSDWLTESRLVFEPLFAMIQLAINDGEAVWITVA